MYEEKNVNEKEHKDYYDESNLKTEYDKAFLELYLANKVLDYESKPLTEKKLLQQMINRMIENILDSNSEMTEKTIKELFEQQLKLIKEANEAGGFDNITVIIIN